MVASIIIPVKNGDKIFEKVLNAVLSQDFEDFEIIIVDSGSKDNSIEMVKSLQKTYKNIILKQIDSEEFGHGKTRNYAASIACGEFLVFITQDALPYNKNWLKEMIKPFMLYKEVVGVFAKHIPYDECDIFEKENLRRHFDKFGEGLILHKIEDKNKYEANEKLRHLLCFYSDNASSMRKSIWEKIPYDNVDFAEDQLWAKKIIELGYTKAYNSDAIVYHSHSYPFKELLQRSYDDFKGLYKIYGYIPVKNIFFLFFHIARATYSDFRFLQTQNMQIHKKLRWALFSVGKNIAKYTGAYLGPKDFVNKFNFIISREHTLRNK